MPRTLTVPLQLRFGDEDSYGHINNVRFVQYLEDARIRLTLEHAGPGTFSEATPSDTFTLVARTEIEYLAPLNFSIEPAAVDVWVVRIGSSSFDLGYSIRENDAAGGAVSALAATTMILVSRDTGRPVALTTGQRAALEAFAGPAVPFRAVTSGAGQGRQ
jgi:acyl-CoA thioester hydrolase